MEDKNKTTLASFTKSHNEMITINENTYKVPIVNERNFRRGPRDKKYGPEEVQYIIESGSKESQIALSRYYFKLGGFYQRILMHYATLLKYSGLVIPNPGNGKSLSDSYVFKKYNNAINLIDSAELPKLFTEMAIRALRDGCYYGILQSVSNTSITILTLPVFYCRSRFKALDGSDLIEFDVTYFDSIVDEADRRKALAAYPKEVVSWYRRFKAGKVKSRWVLISSSVGICLPISEDCRPMFLDVIPAILEYDQARDINRDRDLEEIRKIIVQKIPHLSDGGLLFEPEEAEVIHRGTVGMMKGNENVSVLTTYADVDAIVSKTSNDNATTSIDKALLNIYSKSGASPQLFGTESNLALSYSLTNDMALMLVFARKLEHAITKILNDKFGNTNISFRYTILPITYYNESDYIDTALKMANSGYSFAIPAIALGISQKELGNLKDLENDALKLGEKLIPLATSYTQSGTGEVGRPTKSLEEKSEKTIANERSLDGGGSISNE